MRGQGGGSLFSIVEVSRLFASKFSEPGLHAKSHPAFPTQDNMASEFQTFCLMDNRVEQGVLTAMLILVAGVAFAAGKAGSRSPQSTSPSQDEKVETPVEDKHENTSKTECTSDMARRRHTIETDHRRRTKLERKVWVTPTGDCYHTRTNCGGLAENDTKIPVRLCLSCLRPPTARVACRKTEVSDSSGGTPRSRVLE